MSGIGFAPLGSKATQKAYKLPASQITAVLDSKGPAIVVPKGITAQICADVNGTMINSPDMCTVDCGVLPTEKGGVVLRFDGLDIVVSWENMLDVATGSDGKPTCSLAVADTSFESDPPTYVLGSKFACFHTIGNVHFADPSALQNPFCALLMVSFSCE